MKKVGYFFLIFLPFIIAELIQIFALIYSLIMGIVLALLKPIGSGDFISTLTYLLSDSDFNGMMMIFYSLISTCIFGLWYYIKFEADYLPIKHHGFKRENIISLIGIAVLVPGAQFGATLICSAVMNISPDIYKKYEDLLENAGFDSSMTLILFAYSVILAPLCEELIFRGVTLSCAKRVFPFWLANIIQAALFGAFHMNWVQGIYAFALGLILGYVCEKGKSIYFSLILHFLFNLWGTTASSLLSGLSETVASLIIIFGTLISLLAGFTLFYVGITKRNKSMMLS